MHHALLLAVLIAITSQARTARQPNPSLVRVYVHTDDAGDRAELVARRESVTDLSEALADKKNDVALVEDEPQADVVVEVIDRTVTIPKIVIGLGARPGQTPGYPAPARATHLRVKLVYRDESMVLSNKTAALESNGGWQGAARDIAKQVDTWIVDHRARILAVRARLSAFSDVSGIELR
jgi:hypothetical protein